MDYNVITPADFLNDDLKPRFLDWCQYIFNKYRKWVRVIKMETVRHVRFEGEISFRIEVCRQIFDYQYCYNYSFDSANEWVIGNGEVYAYEGFCDRNRATITLGDVIVPVDGSVCDGFDMLDIAILVNIDMIRRYVRDVLITFLMVLYRKVWFPEHLMKHIVGFI